MRAGDDVPHGEMHENVDVDWLVPTRDNCFDPEILLTRLAVYFDAGELRVVLLLTSVLPSRAKNGPQLGTSCVLAHMPCRNFS